MVLVSECEKSRMGVEKVGPFFLLLGFTYWNRKMVGLGGIEQTEIAAKVNFYLIHLCFFEKIYSG